jgi:hypothetical protein
MYAIISYHDKTYEPLAEYTWTNNKIPYSELYGYHCEFEPCIPVDVNIGTFHLQVQKVDMILRMLDDPANYEWIWWTGCDLMITNFTIKMEDRIDNNYHMVVATDCNGINADSILIRNSPESRAYWQMVSDMLPSCKWDWEGEQGIMKRTYPQYVNQIKIVPQRDINSYDYKSYGTAYSGIDFLGTDGNWKPGDWVIQWPGHGLAKRVDMAKLYTLQVVK